MDLEESRLVQEDLEGSWRVSRESWNFYKNWKDPERFKVLTAPEGFGKVRRSLRVWKDPYNLKG